MNYTPSQNASNILSFNKAIKKSCFDSSSYYNVILHNFDSSPPSKWVLSENRPALYFLNYNQNKIFYLLDI